MLSPASALLSLLLLAGSPALSPEPTHHSDVAAWQRDVVYQIFPRAFSDHSGDGIGDLAGVIDKVPYLHALGVNVVWLNPIYPSGGIDSGYDATDFTGIDPVFGTLQDFAALVQALNERGMKLMMDMVLNHTSIRHSWFEAEVARKTLQRQLAMLVADTDAATGVAIANLLVDPDSAQEETHPHIKAGLAHIQAYDKTDQTAAHSSGYPSQAVAKRAMAEHIAACAGRGPSCPAVQMPFDDFYIWRNTANNWRSWFGGSAWLPVEKVGGVCMHIFSPEQIDLNWRNPMVREAMGEAARTWQKRGVYGFRLDSIGTLAKDPRFPPGRPGPDSLGTPFFTNLPQIHRYIREFTARLGPQATTIGELAANKLTAPIDFAGKDLHELNEVFVFDHITLDGDHAKWRKIPVDISRLKGILGAQQKLIHGRAWLGNYLENHDQLRIVSRYGDADHHPLTSAKAFAALLLTLEGTPFIYQGQELGMTDLPTEAITRVDAIEDVEARGWYRDRVAEGQDPRATLRAVASRCRDNVRSVMQWSAKKNAGFSSAPTKLRVNPNHTSLNVEVEEKDPTSVWSTYRDLIALRRTRLDWVVGDFQELAKDHPKIFAYRRTYQGLSSWVVLNLSSESQTLELPPGTSAVPPGRVLYSNLQPPVSWGSKMTLPPWAAVVWGTEGGHL